MSKKFHKNSALFVEITHDKHQEVIKMFEQNQTFYNNGMLFERMSIEGSATYKIVNKQQFALFCIKYGV